MSAPQPVLNLWAVCDPDGYVNHTTLSTRSTEAIKEWMDQEQTVTRLFRNTPVPSWEGYEAEGYRVVRCDIVPQAHQPEIPS